MGRSEEDEILSCLNDEQKIAVKTTEGPLLVLAGAGSGKTRALTHRIAYLIKHKGVEPHRILAVTFTNKAAEEIASRLRVLVGKEAGTVNAGTFHSICVRILRRELSEVGKRSDFVIFDESDQTSAIKRALKDLNIDAKQLPPKSVRWHIEMAKNGGISAEEFAKETPEDYYRKQVAKIFLRYQQILQENNALDFGDLILETINLFRNHPEILRKYQERFRYILVDEYQDTNRSQYILLNLLCRSHRNICVVGDDDQSIYRWRGAELGNILSFEDDHPRAKVVRLERNYRSTSNILEAASSMVRHNKGRKPKTLWTKREKGELIRYFEAPDEKMEAEFIAREIKKIHESTRYTFNDIAIFYRTNAQSRNLEETLAAHGIPYTVVGAVRFYQRKEIKDVIAYLRVIANHDDNISLSRIINEPPRGIGKVTINRLEELAKMEGISLFGAVKEAIRRKLLSKKACRELASLVEAIEALSAKAEEEKPAKIVKEVLKRTEYIEYLSASSDPESQSRIDNINELVRAAEEFQKKSEEGGFREFLDRVSIISDVDEYEEGGGRVSMMTLHSAKGLEFSVVFIAGMEEGLLPHDQALESEDELEEERRLFYVGMTRAKDILYLTRARFRFMTGSERLRIASRFLSEIPEHLIEQVGAEAETPQPPESTGTTRQFPRPGVRVLHSIYGLGWIVDYEGSGDDLKLTVRFARGGPKKLLAKYANLSYLD